MTPDQIKQLIAQYGQPAYDLAYKQVIINLVITTIVAIVFVVGGLLVAWYSWRKIHEVKETTTDIGYAYYHHDDSKEIHQIAILVSAIFVIVGAAALVFGTLPTVFNIDRAALEYLFGMVGGTNFK